VRTGLVTTTSPTTGEPGSAAIIGHAHARALHQPLGATADAADDRGGPQHVAAVQLDAADATSTAVKQQPADAHAAPQLEAGGALMRASKAQRSHPGVDSVIGRQV
jgi:hypothetical protein